MAADYTFSPSDVYDLPAMGEATVVSVPTPHPVDGIDGGTIDDLNIEGKDHSWTYPSQFIQIQAGSNAAPEGRGVVGLIYPRGI